MQKFSNNLSNLDKLTLISKMIRMYLCRISNKLNRLLMNKFLLDLSFKIKLTKFMECIVSCQ
jgi:hypothetical protein